MIGNLRKVGTCCPDAHCALGSWDGKTCAFCDAICKDCVLERDQ